MPFPITDFGPVVANSRVPADMAVNRNAILDAIATATDNGGTVDIPLGRYWLLPATTKLRAKMGGATTLKGAIGAGDTTIPLASTADLPPSSTVLIETEYVPYAEVSGDSIIGCTRGAGASAHADGAIVMDALVSVDSTAGFPDYGVLRVENEEMFFLSKTDTSYLLAVNSSTHGLLPYRAARGYKSTAIAAHPAGATVTAASYFMASDSVRLKGACPPFDYSGRRSHSGILSSDTRTDLFCFKLSKTSAGNAGFETIDLALSYGRDPFVVPWTTGLWRMENMLFGGCAGSIVNCLGAMEETDFHNIYAYPGTNSIRFRQEPLAPIPMGGYWDKSTVENWVSGGGERAIDIKTGLMNTVTFKNWTSNTCLKDGVVIDAGARGVSLENFNDEGIGRSGKDDVATTLAAIAAGSTSIEANSKGFSPGDPFLIDGAGKYETEHHTTIVEIPDEMHIVFADPTISKIPAGTRATNAIYDAMVLKGGGDYTVVGGTFGSLHGGAGPARGRYGLNANGANRVSLQGCDISGPVYDPGGVVTVDGGNVDLLQSSIAGLSPTVAETGASVRNQQKQKRRTIGSPAGGDIDFFFRDRALSGAGPWGYGKFRRTDPNKTAFAVLDPTNLAFGARVLLLSSANEGWGEGKLPDNSATPAVSSGNRWLASNSQPTTIVNFTGGLDGQLLLVRATNGNTTIAHNANIRLKDGVSKVLAADTLITLIYSTKWHEV